MTDSYFNTPQSTWQHNIGVNLDTVRKEFLHDGFSIGTYPGHDPSEDHAADFMVPAWDTPGGHAKGQRLANYVWENHSGLGLWYVIWYRHIISITPGKSQWDHYINPVPSRRGTPSGDHLNHVHISWHLGSNVPIFHPGKIIGHFHVKGVKDKTSPADQNYVNPGSFLWGWSDNPDHGGRPVQKFDPYQKVTVVDHGHDQHGGMWISDHGIWLRQSFMVKD